MIVDCFQFFNELDILEIRLNVLKNTVDRFVLVESLTTQSGLSKDLIFKNNQDRFSDFRDRITHVVVDDAPINADFWLAERHMRNACERGLVNLPDDAVIMVSDVDEIPNPLKLKQVAKADEDIVLCHRCCYYYLDVSVEQPGNHRQQLTTTVFRRKDMQRPDWYRQQRHSLLPFKDAGWHFSFQGGAEAISTKIKTFAHSEYNLERFTDLTAIRARMRNFRDPFDRPDFVLKRIDIHKEEYPAYLRTNYERFLQKGMMFPG